MGCPAQPSDVSMTILTSAAGSFEAFWSAGRSSLMMRAWARWLTANWISKSSLLRVGGLATTGVS